MNLSNNKILITGGASGIGLGLTERFLKENNKVIICGRRIELLEEVKIKHPSVIIRVCDLSIESERISLYKWVAENHSDLNIIINNAGIQNWMNIDDGDFNSKMTNEIATNILAPLHLINLFMNHEKLDTIINVTSGLAFVPFSKVSVYSATKAFMRSFTLSLRHQLKSKKIEVIEMIPPALNTDLGGKGIHDGAPLVKDFILSVFEQLKNGNNELTFLTSEPRVKENNETISKYFEMINP